MPDNVTLGSANVTLPGHSAASGSLSATTVANVPLRSLDELGIAIAVNGVRGAHPLVLLEDDPVTDAERLGTDPDLGSQLTGCLTAGPDHLVQRGDVGSPDGQDGGRVVAMDAPPVLHDALAGLRRWWS